ncbi:hypothetical protein [Marinoscillum sp.]|uniref:hypothetical protein n=1 Tax=Marinoscillum sp. TaxID=2024838 RepID=UPI003BAA0E89
MRNLISLSILSLLMFGCSEEELPVLKHKDPQVGDCFYESSTHCQMAFDTLNAPRDYWRNTGRSCNYLKIGVENLDVVFREDADYVIMDQVPFWMTVTWELRVKINDWSKCSYQDGSPFDCQTNQFPALPDRVGCQTICPENPVIRIPTDGLTSNLDYIQYEVIVHGFCGRMVLFGRTLTQ